MDVINQIIDSYNIPILTAFLLGILTSISPCPLATNITAVAFISRDVKSAKNTLVNGLMYTIGRGMSYTVLALVIYFGFSAFQISQIFQGWGDKILGPALIVIGLVMFGVIRIDLGLKTGRFDKLKESLARRGYIGSFFLGLLFALAFCPYSGVLFFGVLVPMLFESSYALLLPPVFALGTGLPVIVFSIIIAFSIGQLTKAFSLVSKLEKIMRYTVATIFIATGVYYLQFLVTYLLQR